MMTRIVVLLAALLLSGCASGTMGIEAASKAEIVPDTLVTPSLATLPTPERRVPVAVYNFQDLTGQAKPNGRFAESSRAVTQGGTELLIEALLRAGNGEWFEVLERRYAKELLQERQIIQATRKEYEGKGAPTLKPLRFAGVMLAGGIVAYESNLRTGGAGARYLGIGANGEYQVDRVTVALRAVSVQTGRVLASVTATKEIYSTLLQFSVFKYASVDSLLEIETGLTRNQPPQMAVREAIELSVLQLVEDGINKGLWKAAPEGVEVAGADVAHPEEWEDG